MKMKKRKRKGVQRSECNNRNGNEINILDDIHNRLVQFFQLVSHFQFSCWRSHNEQISDRLIEIHIWSSAVV